MSSPGDLSRLLNNVNVAVYPSEPLAPPPLPLHATLPPLLDTIIIPSAPKMAMPHFTDISYSSDPVEAWHHVHPMEWTKDQVMDWVRSQGNDVQSEACLLNFDYYGMDGATLCSLPHQAFISMCGSFGERLYQNLDRLRSRSNVSCEISDPFNETCSLLNEFLGNLPQTFLGDSLGLLDTVVVNDAPGLKKERDSYNYYGEVACRDMTPRSDGYESGSSMSDSQHSSTLGSLMHPSSPESMTSDSDPEYQERTFTISKTLTKQERGDLPKRGRGRPPKSSRGGELYMETKKNKHAPRGTHLWEFIRDILINPERNQGLMKWEDRHDGVFKFLKSEAVAQLWGQKKKNTSMTYEKLSRAMRYYYKREILERVDGRRLVYKFGKNASGWKLEELGLKM